MERSARRTVLVCVGLLLIPNPTEVNGEHGFAQQADSRLKAEVDVYTRILPNVKAGWLEIDEWVRRAGELTVIVETPTVDLQHESWWTRPGWGDRPYDLRRGVPEAPEAVVADFLRANAKQRDLRNAFGSDTHVIVLSRARLHEFFKPPDLEEDWERFYSAYPGSAGFVQFSRVGFDETGTTALVYAGNTYSGLGGRGDIVLLRREGNEWRIVSRHGVWVS